MLVRLHLAFATSLQLVGVAGGLLEALDGWSQASQWHQASELLSL